MVFSASSVSRSFFNFLCPTIRGGALNPQSVGRLIALLTLGAIATGSVFFFWLRRTLPYYPAETVAAFYEALATFYRPVFFVILAIWCAGLNAHFLNRSGISLSLAFQIETLYVKNIHRSLFLAASGLSFLFTWSLILFAILLDPAIPVTVHHGLPIKALIAPFTTFLAMPLILIMPLDILGLPQRRGLMRSAKRVFLAPFYPVPFCDIVLADVFTSYSRPLAEIILAFAWIFGTIFRVGVPSSHAWHKINPFILALPPLWRLLQCLRAYHTDRKPRHLANAVKYSSSFPVIFISAQISSFQVDSPFFSYWLIAAFINMSISIYWDFVQDFGLCYFHSGVKYPGLRTYLIYRHPWMYYMAMAFDFAARAAWSYRLTTSFKDFPEASVLLLQTIESFRRCIWIFFRVEHRMLADNLFRKEILLQPGAGGPQRPMPSLSSANAHSEGTGATPLIISTGAGLGAHAHDSPGGSPLAEAPLPHWN